MDSHAWVPMLSGYLYLLPLFLIWVGGIVFAVATWKKHPAVSGLLIAGLAILLVSGVSGNFFTYFFLGFHRTGMTVTSAGILHTVVSSLRTLLSAVGYVFIIWAVFKNR